MGLNPMVGQAIGKLQIAQGTLASMDWKRVAHDERAISYLVSAIQYDIQSAALLLEQSQPPKSGLDKVMLALSEEDELRARAKAAEAEIERLREDRDGWREEADRLGKIAKAFWNCGRESDCICCDEVTCAASGDKLHRALVAYKARKKEAETKAAEAAAAEPAGKRA